jgi:hypothetical protein
MPCSGLVIVLGHFSLFDEHEDGHEQRIACGNTLSNVCC